MITGGWMNGATRCLGGRGGAGRLEGGLRGVQCEAWHSVVTHPQILPFTADANTRYDLYGDHMNRAITPNGTLSPTSRARSQYYVIDKLAEFLGAGDRHAAAGTRPSQGDLKGFDACRSAAGAQGARHEANREGFAAMNGHDDSQASDSEMLDNLTYNIFPNWSPWGGFVPNIVYRWRPWKRCRPLPDGSAHPDARAEGREAGARARRCS